MSGAVNMPTDTMPNPVAEAVSRLREAADNIERARMSGIVENLAGWEQRAVREAAECIAHLNAERLSRERDTLNQAREALARTERDRDMWKDQCARQADQLSAINELPQECVNSLTHQRQIDMDGCEVGVSRQAVDEIHAALMRARSVLNPEKEEKA